MHTVFFKRTESYDYKLLSQNIGMLLDSLKLNNLQNRRVLIKPDFLYIAEPEQAVTTHPQLLKVVCSYFLDYNAKVSIRSRHLSGRFSRFLRQGGYREALAGMPVSVDTFKRAVMVEFGEPFGRLSLPRELVETELFVNMPKLKTHCRVGLNACVSNIFDCITLAEKRQCFQACDGEVNDMARLLAKIAHTLMPEISLVDGIVGLEGQGPGVRGEPKAYNILACGDNAFYVDAALARYMGMLRRRLPVLEQAAEMGLYDPNHLVFFGEFYTMQDVKIPPRRQDFKVPEKYVEKARKVWFQRVVQKKSCNLCGACAKVCPSEVITFDEASKRLIVDHSKCLRCYSCMAACPRGSLAVENPLRGKVMRRFFDKRARVKMLKEIESGTTVV